MREDKFCPLCQWLVNVKLRSNHFSELALDPLLCRIPLSHPSPEDPLSVPSLSLLQRKSVWPCYAHHPSFLCSAGSSLECMHKERRERDGRGTIEVELRTREKEGTGGGGHGKPAENGAFQRGKIHFVSSRGDSDIGNIPWSTLN